ncbi:MULTISPECIES: hypothetical protein [unclassified Streptomyces]|uniref:hypothetical protein n=1 Tax=unclassified Streptomyces TaxID=2593676 RepID=UPI0033AF69CD
MAGCHGRACSHPRETHPHLCDGCKGAAVSPGAGTQERQEPVRGETALDDFWPHPERPVCTECGAAFTDERWKATARVAGSPPPAKRPSLCGDCDQRFEADLDRTWGVSPRQEACDQEQKPAVPEQKTEGRWFSRFRA